MGTALQLSPAVPGGRLRQAAAIVAPQRPQDFDGRFFLKAWVFQIYVMNSFCVYIYYFYLYNYYCYCYYYCY